jgi:GT2 family glycosyltransferase
MARYEYLVIIDDDVLVASDWLANLIQGLINGGTKCAVSGKVLASGSSDDNFTPSTKTDDKPARYAGRTGKDVLWSNNMAMPRSAINDIGFFDERLGPGTDFPAAEDNDYGFRLLEAGYQILYLPSAIVYHRDWRLKKDYVNLRWKYGVGRGAFYAKYFSLHDRYNFNRMIRDMRNHVLSSLYNARRDGLKSYGDLALVGGILVGACRWLAHYGLIRR